jgi:NAD(P)-dependent dehydrogenase (short-subunit alcohol dehydrogenase family)
MTFNTKDLTGRVVVVTGAGSGIGRELAVHAARRGATLSLCDRDEMGLQQTLDLVRASGITADSQVVDVSDAEQMAVFGKTTIEQFGAPDLLINNAGIAVIGGILDTTLNDWDRLLGVNIMGVVHGINAFVPAMAERGTGTRGQCRLGGRTARQPTTGRLQRQQTRRGRAVRSATHRAGSTPCRGHGSLSWHHQHRDHAQQLLPRRRCRRAQGENGQNLRQARLHPRTSGRQHPQGGRPQPGGGTHRS